MNNGVISISTLDCTPFPFAMPQQVIGDFISRHRKNVFWFSSQNKYTDDCNLAEYDYRENCWRAGRFIGEATVEHQGQLYRISVKPRFGNSVFFRMLEEIHNIKITASLSSFEKSLTWSGLLQKVMAFIWLGKLSDANLHGLPRAQQKVRHVGSVVRGSLHVRETVKRLYHREQLVSYSREKVMDEAVAQLIFQAYQILKKDLKDLSGRMLDRAMDALNQVLSQVHSKRHVSVGEYNSIRFNDVYLSWKPIVDFSWEIIQRQHQQLENSSDRKGFGFFIDMAEIWEQYLRSLLKKKLMPLGWKLLDNQLSVYEGTFFKRLIIPDIIFEKENSLLIWDAKYKRMDGRHFDLDRADFFQIHTYMQYYLSHRNVIAGGLLYPLSGKLSSGRSSYLLMPENLGTTFLIDGVEFRQGEDSTASEDILQMEAEFLERIVEEIGREI